MVLEMDHLRSRFLSYKYHTSYLKTILTQIVEHKMVLIVLLQKSLCSSTDFIWSENILAQHEISGFSFSYFHDFVLCSLS